MERDKAKSDKFAIYRMADAPPYAELDVMVTEHLTPIISDGLQLVGGRLVPVAVEQDCNVIKLLYETSQHHVSYASDAVSRGLFFNPLQN